MRKSMIMTLLAVSLATAAQAGSFCDGMDHSFKGMSFPKQVDEVTIGLSASCKNDHVSTHFLVTDERAVAFLRGGEDVMREETCNEPLIKRMTSVGISAEYTYYADKTYEMILNFTCKPEGI